MTRTALIVFAVASLSTGALSGQRGATPPPPPPLEPGASQADVDKALVAAPSGQRDQATVIKWKAPDFTYDTLRKGTNRLVCYDRSGFAQQAPFSVQCTSIANIERVAQNLKAEALGDKTKSEAMLKDLESKGQRVKPEYGSMWHSVAGPDKERATRHHAMIAVPGATTQSTGLPDNPRQGGAWIMNAGTTTAHIMMPGQ
jgi:hypothetical protein